MENKPKRGWWDRFFIIFTIQFICVAVIISALAVTKYFFEDTFEKISEFYKESFLVETEVYGDGADEV